MSARATTPHAAVAVALRAVDAACAVGAGFAALSAAALAMMLIAEVLLTTFAAWSQPWVVEYSTYFQAVVMFGGAGWALRNGGHIRVMMLSQALPATARRAADAVVTAFALGVIGFAAWALINQALRSFDFGSVSFYPTQTPVWMPQSVLATGFVLFALALLARLVRLVLNAPPEIANTVGGTIE